MKVAYCTALTQVKNALKVSYDLDTGGQDVTFDFIANSMSAEAASLPEHVPNRQASGVGSSQARAQRPRAESRDLTA